MAGLMKKLDKRVLNNLPLILAIFAAVIGYVASYLRLLDEQKIVYYLFSLSITMSIYSFQRLESIKRTSDSVEHNLEKNPLRTLDSISANIISLKHALNLMELCKGEYKSIKSASEYYAFRNKQMEHLENQLLCYKDKGFITNLSPEDTFDLTINLFAKMGMDKENIDYIKAVSFLEKEEWQDLSYWNDYVASQQKAATERNVIVERIFITTPEDLKQKLTFLEVVQKHAVDNYNKTHLRGYFLDVDNKGPYDEDLMGHGFLLLKSKNECLAVVDHFKKKEKVGKTDNKNNDNNILSYKTELVFDIVRLDKIERYFDQRVNGAIQDPLPRFKLDGSLVRTKVR